MLYLILAIVCGTTFAVLFKIFACKNIDSLQAIIFNYITAFCLGLALNFGGDTPVNPLTRSWLPVALIMGAMFMFAFVLMSYSTARSGVAVTTISARVSLVIPVVCSYLFIAAQPQPRWASVAIVAAALVLMFLPRKGSGQSKLSFKTAIYPLGVFLLFGINNFCLKYTQSGINTSREIATLTAVIFLSAAIVSTLYYLIFAPEPHRFNWKNLLGGVALGTANFFATYLTLLSLGKLPAGVFFPIYNVGIVLAATAIGILCFKERLSKLQILGVLLAIVGIVSFFI